MRITANLGVNVENFIYTFDLEDLGLTESEWNALTKDEQEEVLQDAINDLNEQPYWMLENFETD